MSIDEIRIVKEKIIIDELKKVAEERFGDLVKAVVDIQKGIMAVGGELHADEEAVLLEQGSKQEDLWGINLYPDSEFDKMVEFDSMINIRPNQNNCSRDVKDESVRQAIVKVVKELLKI